MKHGSLFSGIGGFDLAAQWMDWENVFHCEWNDFGQKILKHYWPNAISYHDITKTDFTIHRGEIDILTGGFPCQPYSAAGKRKGTEDDRHLWPEMLRAIREIQPRNVVGENVRGLTNWNGGLVFDQVQADLENEGYEVTPFLLPACAVNAPHRRDRIWFIANTIDSRYCAGRKEIQRSDGIQGEVRATVDSGRFDRTNISSEIIADTSQIGLHSSKTISELEWQRLGGVAEHGQYWKNFTTQSPICSGNDGVSGRLDGITFSKWRNESIKGYGNAIVPQIALQIFKAIQQIDSNA